MAELATISRPYANAVFGLAKSEGTLAQWSDVLAVLDTTCLLYTSDAADE